ncbi:MAG: choice-of-anchor A family protein [Zavarzinella sp.]
MMDRTTTLTLNQLEARDNPTIYGLGVATDFNLFALESINVYNSDIGGRVAVGQNANINNYGLGHELTNSNGTRDDLIVEGNLTFNNGQVFNGNIVYGGAASLNSIGVPNGTVRQEAGVVDFAAAQAELEQTSDIFCAETPNGTTRFTRRVLTLAGNHPTINIFEVHASQLETAHSIILLVPPGSDVLINVRGLDVDIHNLGLHFRGADCDDILWNFCSAETLDMSAVDWQGSILAPRTDVRFDNGQMHGTMVARNYVGNGQLHNCTSTFAFDIPEYANISGLVFIDQFDGNGFRNSTYDPGEEFPLVEVDITGVDILGRAVNRTEVTVDDGTYQFVNLWPGEYDVAAVVPDAFQTSTEDGIPGSLGGTPAPNSILNILANPGDDGTDYQIYFVDALN